MQIADPVFERGQKAKRLLDDHIVQEAFEAIEADLVRALRQSAIGDVDAHHNLTLSLQAIDGLKRKLASWVADGEAVVKRAEQEGWRDRMLKKVHDAYKRGTL